MMRLKAITMTSAAVVIATLGFVGGSIDSSVPGWVTLQQAEASPYRRSVRRTARRTSRRTAHRNSHYY